MNLIERYLNNQNTLEIDNDNLNRIIVDINNISDISANMSDTIANSNTSSTIDLDINFSDLATADEINRIDRRINVIDNENVTQNEQISILENIVANLDADMGNYMREENFLPMLNNALQNYLIDNSALRSLAEMLRSYIGIN